MSSLEAGLLSGPLAGSVGYNSISSSGGLICNYYSSSYTRIVADLNNDNLPDYLGIDSINGINVGILNTPYQNPTIAVGQYGRWGQFPASLAQYSLNYTFLHTSWATILQKTVDRFQTIGDANGDGYKVTLENSLLN